MNTSSKIIIVLLIVNLSATIWFGISSKVSGGYLKVDEKASEHQLPKLIDESVKLDILNSFIQHFNDEDYDGLYGMFGSVAQAQIPKDKMYLEFGKFTKFFHSIESGSFSFSELSGQQGSTTIYVLHYVVKLPKESEIGRVGTLKVTIAIEGNGYQVYGMHLNAGI